MFWPIVTYRLRELDRCLLFLRHVPAALPFFAVSRQCWYKCKYKDEQRDGTNLGVDNRNGGKAFLSVLRNLTIGRYSHELL